MKVECNNTSSNSSHSSSTNTGSLSNQSITIGSAAGSNAAASQVAATNSNSSSNLNAKNKKLFPKKLWDLINNEKYYYCLRWSEDGQLVYLNRDEFEESYLKTSENQFHTQKAISFVRQMNMYGFRKVDDCYYENDNFKRGCEHLLKDMTRKHPNKSHHHHIASQHLSQQQQHHHHLNQQQQQMINDQSSLLAQRRLLLSSAAADGRTQNSLLLDHHLGANHAQASVAGEPATTNTVPLGALDQGADLPRTFYALLSSLYSQQLPLDQGSPLDTFAGKSFPPAASLPQQIFQNLMAQQDLASSVIYSGQPFHHDLAAAAAAAAAATTTTKDLFAHTPSLQAPKWTLDQVQPQVQQQQTTGQASSLLMGSRTTSATSLLAPSIMSSMSNKYSGGGSSSSSSTSNIASDLSLKHLRNCKPLDSDASSVISSLRCLSPGDNNSCSSSASVRLQHQQQQQQSLSSRLATLVSDAPLPLPLKRRQDQRLVRSFKRSVDSILDSNEITTQSSGGSSNRNRAAFVPRPATIGDESVVSVNKRIKLECCRQATENNVAGDTDKQRQPPPTSMLGGGVNELAKNLVSEIALSRDAHLTASVLHEASKYTESFVQTLFDTALVIARHSNGLNLSDYMLAADANYQPISAAAAAGTNVAVNEDAADCDEDEDGFGYQHEPEYERSSNISVSDLTSALKLLPSKLLKILQ